MLERLGLKLFILYQRNMKVFYRHRVILIVLLILIALGETINILSSDLVLQNRVEYR